MADPTELLKAEAKQRVQDAKMRLSAYGITARSPRKRKDEKRRSAIRQPILTPRARLKMPGKVRLTILDEMTADIEAAALERWAFYEQTLQGRAKAVNLEGGSGQAGVPSLIPDRLLPEIQFHVRNRAQIGGTAPQALVILDAFTKLQNGAEDALAPAQCGLRYFPKARNKRDAFFRGVVDAARVLVRLGY